ncbi:MAG: hypothetical protein HY072_01065, partial [Deltaproteobacteria bacterium]|nr:hypothetical protein [Deltaproteobacteria bacterium]
VGVLIVLSLACEQKYSLHVTKQTTDTQTTDASKYNPNFSFSFRFSSSVSDDSVWVATTSKHVYNILLDKTNNYPMLQWSLQDGQAAGTRTTVTEAGAVFSQYGRVWIINRKTPTNVPVPLVYQAADAVSYARSCVTTYRILDRSYVAMIYASTEGMMKLAQFPILENQSLGNAEVFTIFGSNIGGIGAYSCGIHQQSYTLYWAGGIIQKLNVTNKEYLGSAGSSGMYAMALSSDGKVLNSSGGAYTAAHEQLSHVIFQSSWGAGLKIYPDSCAANLSQCQNTRSITTGLSSLGPLSSLNNGKIAGLVRGTGAVYLIGLTNTRDINSDVSVTLIKVLNEDPYMYSDFTGSTTYAKSLDQTVDLRTLKGFDAQKGASNALLSWEAESGTNETWKGMSLQAKCFNDNTKAAAPMEDISPVAVAGERTLLKGSCLKPGFDRVQVKIFQTTPSSEFSRTRGFTVFATQ